jgi:hypothetical protein
MSYAAIFTAASDEAFQGRCLVATWTAAQNILNEDPGTQNYEQRRGWAFGVLAGTNRITAYQLAVQVLRNPTIAGNPTAASDSDIQFQVNSIIPDIIQIG